MDESLDDTDADALISQTGGEGPATAMRACALDPCRLEHPLEKQSDAVRGEAAALLAAKQRSGRVPLVQRPEIALLLSQPAGHRHRPGLVSLGLGFRQDDAVGNLAVACWKTHFA